MAISAACSKASPVNKKRKRDTEYITSSLFMGTTGPLGAPPAAIASADCGDLVRPKPIIASGSMVESNLLRIDNDSDGVCFSLEIFPVEDVRAFVLAPVSMLMGLFLILFQILLRMESFLRTLSTAKWEFFLIYETSLGAR